MAPPSLLQSKVSSGRLNTQFHRKTRIIFVLYRIHGEQTVITIQTVLSLQSLTGSPSKTVLPLSLPLPIQVAQVVEANVVEICEQTCTLTRLLRSPLLL